MKLFSTKLSALIANTLSLVFVANMASAFEITGSDLVVSAKEEADKTYTAALINEICGSGAFYNYGIYGEGVKVANIEGGIGWPSHDFLKDATLGETFLPEGSTAESLYTSHATGCGMIMAGYNADSTQELPFYMAYGIARSAELSFASVSKTVNDDGTFNVDSADFITVYKHFFGTSDVINSSWGPDTSTPNDFFAQTLDAMAKANTKTTLVLAAGNTGSATNTVSSMALSQNTITVGALGNPNSFDEIADYSSRSPSDFYNPITGETVVGVRAAVDITAPGTNIVIPYYDKDNPATTDSYAIASGTSFASPIVAGTVALLKSTSVKLEADKTFTDAGWSDKARDTRVIKAVLLNSASKPMGWDNGQKLQNGVEFKVELSTGAYYTSSYDNVIVTKQALDFTYGAGILNGEAALQQYVGMYTEGNANNVWALNDITKGESHMFRLGTLNAGDIVTATLVWLLNNTLVESADPLTGPTVTSAFADLSLELWVLEEGAYKPIAISDSDYSAVEHLSITLAALGEYFLRVAFFDMAYGDMDDETYALAWNLIPEPSQMLFAIFALIATICFSRIRFSR